MGQDLELIVELLREMRAANSTNSQSFDNLLEEINDKIDVMGRNNASTEFLKACLSELAKNIEEKYSTTLAGFAEIEKALKQVYKVQDEHVKNRDLKELFEVFSINLNNFYTESRQQRTILSSLETRLEGLSTDKSDKEDVLRTITLLRNDFENLNHSYRNAIDNVNSDLKAVLNGMIKLDQSAINAQISEQVGAMYKATVDIINYLNSIDKRDANLEKILANVATNESMKLTQGVIDSIIKKSEEISEKLTTLADKKDITGLENAASIMNDKLDEVMTKELFRKITSATDALYNQTDEVKQTLATVTKNIDAQPDIRMFEDALQNLFKEFNNLSKDISLLDSGKNLTEIDYKVTVLANELEVIRNIASDINEAMTSRVLSAINDISFDNQSYDIKNHITKMLSELPQKEDIDRLLEDNMLSKSAFETLIEKADMLADRIDTLPTHNDLENLNKTQINLIDNLQEIALKSDIEDLGAKADEIEEMIDNINFDDEFGKLYDKTLSIENWLSESSLKEKSEEILSQFPLKANQKDLLKILSTSNKIATDLEELSQNTDARKVNRTVSELYSMIEELKNDFINTTEMHNDSVVIALSELQEKASKIVTVDEFSKFIEDLRAFLSDNIDSTQNLSTDVNSALGELKKTLSELRGALADRETSNKGVQALTEKLETLIEKTEQTEVASAEEMSNSLKELSDIKSQIQELGNSFSSMVDNENSANSQISEFISSKLNEISSDLTEFSDNMNNKISNGFVLNAEMIEEKTGMLLELIKELRHSNSDNINMYERLTVADNRLIDFKQELELVNTDIINNLNSSAESILKELTPLKELVTNTLSNTVKASFDNLSEDEIETISTNLSGEETLKKIDDVYVKISNEISANETNLRDFILGDIDSVLIKIDNLKTELEDSLTSITPADMPEIRKFADEIESFKATQEECFNRISSSITEQITAQGEELKSLLKISDNNSEIIEAIEDLKKYICKKLNNSGSSDEFFAPNEYEKEFESNSLDSIKADFEKFAVMICNLTDKNSAIEEVLNTLKEKLDNQMNSIDIIDEISEELDENDENFDVIKALSLLQKDIRKIHADISSSQPVNKEWLEEVKTYIAGDDIRTMLTEINNKIDVLTLSDNNDWVEDIKQVMSTLNESDIDKFSESNSKIQSTLTLINEKLDILSDASNIENIEDIKYSLEAIEEKLNTQDSSEQIKKTLSESDARITAMLETLNYKIDILANYDDSETQFAIDEVKALLVEQRENLDKLETNDKTDAFKKCLDELTDEVNNINSTNSNEIQKTLKDMKESIMAAVVTIFEQVSFIEETEEIKDFVEEKTDEINKNLIEVTEQLKQIANTDNDYTYSMQDIESDLAKLRLALNKLELTKEQDESTEQLAYILDNINRIGSSVENLQNSIKEDDLYDLKIRLNEIALNSDESYNSIGRFLTNQLSAKVDNVTKLIEHSNDSNKVMRQALIYIGEWIDGASESMNKISTNSDELLNVKSAIEALKSSVPAQTNLLNSIEEKFNEQQERIDRLEMALGKILSAVEDMDDSKVTRKIDKIDKQIAKLSTNIEKLASYVD